MQGDCFIGTLRVVALLLGPAEVDLKIFGFGAGAVGLDVFPDAGGERFGLPGGGDIHGAAVFVEVGDSVVDGQAHQVPGHSDGDVQVHDFGAVESAIDLADVDAFSQVRRGEVHLLRGEFVGLGHFIVGAGDHCHWEQKACTENQVFEIELHNYIPAID
jgi:hypothetical protein